MRTCRNTIARFRQIEEANPQAERILIVCDNARYYRSKEVTAYLESNQTVDANARIPGIIRVIRVLRNFDILQAKGDQTR
jgi:transposase